MTIKSGPKDLATFLAVALALLVSMRNASAADAPAKVVRVGYLEFVAPGGPPMS